MEEINQKFQHTAARRRLENMSRVAKALAVFQHTAARRRLACRLSSSLDLPVSTHSRPKAAVAVFQVDVARTGVSTHSRPKAAGCLPVPDARPTMFQHTAARRRLFNILSNRLAV